MFDTNSRSIHWTLSALCTRITSMTHIQYRYQATTKPTQPNIAKVNKLTGQHQAEKTGDVQNTKTHCSRQKRLFLCYLYSVIHPMSNAHRPGHYSSFAALTSALNWLYTKLVPHTSSSHTT